MELKQVVPIKYYPVMCVHLFYSCILFKALWGLHFIHIFYLKPSEGYLLKPSAITTIMWNYVMKSRVGDLSHNANYIWSFFAGVSSITVSLLAQHTHWTCSTSLLPLPVKYALVCRQVSTAHLEAGGCKWHLEQDHRTLLEKGFIDAYIPGRQK